MTWCYPVESGQQYCATGFPMGCYVDKQGNPKDACVISREYTKPDSYYVFNHVDVVVAYHSGNQEEWGQFLQAVAGLGQLRVRVVGDRLSCPEEGIVRDLGTIIGQPRVIGLAAAAQRVD